MSLYVYSEDVMIPKFHYLVHYPEPIFRVGPMQRTWTMRHEAKLNMLKLASRLGNFKNIAMSLAFRHQRLLCYELSTGRLLDTPIEAGPCSKPTSEDSEPQHVQESLKAIIPGLNGEASLCQRTWVKKDGLNFKQSNCYVIIGTDHHQAQVCHQPSQTQDEVHHCGICVQLIGWGLISREP